MSLKPNVSRPAARPPGELKKTDRTRATILEVARQLFAERGPAVTVREVAAAAGIDPAFVIRYFRSKDELFLQAREFRLQLPPVNAGDAVHVGERLVRHFLALWEGPQADMAILLRSAASNEASAQQMQDIFTTQVMPVIEKLGTRASAGRRAGLVATQLLGLALCRYVLRLPPIAQMKQEDIVKFVVPTIQRYALGSARTYGLVEPAQRGARLSPSMKARQAWLASVWLRQLCASARKAGRTSRGMVPSSGSSATAARWSA